MKSAIALLFVAAQVLTAAGHERQHHIDDEYFNFIMNYPQPIDYCHAQYKVHMLQGRSLGVHIPKDTPWAVTGGFVDALRYWGMIADIRFYADDNPKTCSFSLDSRMYSGLEGTFLIAKAEEVDNSLEPTPWSAFTGTISYSAFCVTPKYLKRSTWRHILIHELGHELGLVHNPDRRSVMYFAMMFDGKDSDRPTSEEMDFVRSTHRSMSLFSTFIAKTVDNIQSLWYDRE